MSLHKIIGQKRVKEIIKDILIRKRIPNAFLFYGNNGVGKDATAIQFAKILNCSKNNLIQSEIIENETFLDSCDQCPDCIKFDRFQHPNFKLVFSLPRGKNEKEHDDAPLEKLSSEDMANIREEINKKAQNHYYDINIPNANEIRIISIRELKKALSLSISEGKYRVVLITNAEEMNIESSNAFLKILEEPPQKTLFILATSKKDNILPTIISRCQELFFDDLLNDEIEYGLKEYFKIEAEKAKIIAQLSQGSFSRALQLLDENFNEYRNSTIEFLRIILSNKFQLIFSEIDRLISEKDRTKIESGLLLLLSWFRDIILFKEGLSTQIINIDQSNSLISFCQKLPRADVNGSIIEIENAIKLLNRNVNLQLIFYNLVINLRKYILK